MVKNSRKQRNLIGLVQQLVTDIEIAQTQITVSYNSGVGYRILEDLETCVEALNYYIDIYTSLMEDEQPLDEEDLPF